MTGRWGSILLLWVLVTGGCVKRVPSGPVSDREPPSVEVVSQKLASMQGAQALRATFRLQIKTRERNDSVIGELIARAPAELRVALTSMLGPPLGHAAVSGDAISLYLPYSGNAFLSSTDPAAIARRLSGGTLSATDMVGLFLGKAPPCQPVGEVHHRKDDDRFLVQCAARSGASAAGYRLLLEPGTLQVVGVEGATAVSGEQKAEAPAGVAGPAGAGQPFTARFSDFREVGGLTLPYHLELEASGAGLSVTVHYSEIELNPAIEEGLFTLTPPDDARQVPLEGLFPG